ncbi:MAG TPA: response regulator [Candidatus Acidoferrum sp.]|nr:response regulator [Candidatus Acidoferrum sp.]
MPKILVADDNSNIQKMVGLALKDQGIDVVAVGNGEAAVRKIADVRPDLVLADVFMPVRNGYEVCQFVKMDSSLSHIPVILLVGAFDPLDEQEAQRVGADGVLKKPFIPPDPLISMVKSALQRSGSSPAGTPAASAEKLEESTPFGAKEMPQPANASVPAVMASPVPEFNLGSSPEALNESFVEDVPPRPEPFRIDSGSQPVAFGSLLETPAEAAEVKEPAEDDSNFTAASSPEFAMEHDWRDRDEEEMDAEEEDEEPAAWRPEGTEDTEEVQAAKTKKPKSSTNDWRMGGFEVANKSRSTGWEPEEEAPAPSTVETAAPAASSRIPATSAPTETLAPAAKSRVPEMPATPPAPVKPVQEESPVPSKPFIAETWKPPVAPVVPPPAAVGPPSINKMPVTEKATAVVEDSKAKAEAETKPAAEKKDGKDSWFSVSSSPWEGEIQKASQLASTWDAPSVSASKNGNEKASEATPIPETAAVIEEAALPPATVEAIREEAAQVAEDATFILETPETASSNGDSFYAHEEEGVLEPNSPTAKAAAPAPAPSATPAPNMDDLVAKVLAKMNPDVLQAVTREILKPVVEAMVKEELKSKKS